MDNFVQELSDKVLKSIRSADSNFLIRPAMQIIVARVIEATLNKTKNLMQEHRLFYTVEFMEKFNNLLQQAKEGSKG